MKRSPLNQPSVDKFQDAVKANGVIIYDSSNVIVPPSRTDVTVVPIAAEEEAIKLGNTRIRNMVTLGALLSVVEVVSVNSVMKGLAEVLPERYHHLLDLNHRALARGEELVVEAATPIV